MRTGGILVVVACFLVLGSEAGPSFSRTATDKVLEKLSSLDNGSDKSGLAMADLDAAYKEYKSWTDATIEDLKSSDSMVKFLIHFLYLPMGKFSFHVGSSSEDIEVQHYFIERLDRNYKRFKTQYLGKTVGNFFTRTPKTSTLESSLFKLKDGQPLTKQMFQQSKLEYEALAARTEEMAEYDDVYASLGELENNLNYLNRPTVRVLVETVFPAFENEQRLGKFDPEYLTNLFQVHMTQRGIISRDGVLYALPGFKF